MSKIRYFIVIFFIVFIIVLVILGLSKNKNIKEPIKQEPKVDISFIDETNKEKNIEVFTKDFEPDSVSATVDGVDSSNLVLVDSSKLDLTKVGTYEIKYYLTYEGKEYKIIQTINVIDSEAPKIKLKGSSVTILVGEEYKEPGFTATDEYDGDISKKVEITNSVNNKKAGNYEIVYSVIDSSGNKTEQKRKVVVKKANTVVATPPKEVKVKTQKIEESNYTNTLKTNKFNNSNIHLEGYIKNSVDSNKLKLVGDENYEFDLNLKNSNYSIDINPEEINNGKYTVYVNDEKLLNKITPIERITRAKVGSKLVTFSYNEKDEVSVEISNHSYQYDILINPGHGGNDTGAVNKYIEEKEMNLEISLYEKCRYEAHGLRVYMTRTNDSYNDKIGPKDVIKLHRIGYEMGYYGAVSKIVYSNHHNSINNTYYSGWEILVPAALTKEELSSEHAIANKWNNIFKLKENHKRFYTRNYDTDAIYSKQNGEVYSFKDYYAINRIPYITSNVKSVIFEDCYMSNLEEFKWYWQDKNWYEVSEAKIEVYVKALGLTYNSDNSSCIK